VPSQSTEIGAGRAVSACRRRCNLLAYYRASAAVAIDNVAPPVGHVKRTRSRCVSPPPANFVWPADPVPVWRAASHRLIGSGQRPCDFFFRAADLRRPNDNTSSPSTLDPNSLDVQLCLEPLCGRSRLRSFCMRNRVSSCCRSSTQALRASCRRRFGLLDADDTWRRTSRLAIDSSIPAQVYWVLASPGLTIPDLINGPTRSAGSVSDRRSLTLFRGSSPDVWTDYSFDVNTYLRRYLVLSLARPGDDQRAAMPYELKLRLRIWADFT